MFGGVEVGFAGGEAIDIFICCLQGFGLVVDGERWQGGNMAGLGGEWCGRVAYG